VRSGAWGGRFADPVFVFTGDQDWATAEALAVTLDETVGNGVPFHLFVTNSTEAVSRPPVGLSLGIHPNFLPGSTHGSCEEDVIEHCLALVPMAKTFRCHSFFEHTRLLGRLLNHGLRADSNLGLFAQPDLLPLLHCTGLLRFPVFFEDDVFLNLSGSDLSLGALRRILFTPGLKIFNFHPALVGANVPSQDFYDAHKAMMFDPTRASRKEFHGRGTRNLLHELVHEVQAGGGEIVSFPVLVEECVAWLASNREDWLYEWGNRLWSQPAAGSS
jgi:hypothetical protein